MMNKRKDTLPLTEVYERFKRQLTPQTNVFRGRKSTVGDRILRNMRKGWVTPLQMKKADSIINSPEQLSMRMAHVATPPTIENSI